MTVFKKILQKLSSNPLYSLPFVFCAIFLICTDKYLQKYFSTMTAAEFIFFLNTPMEGADKRMVHIFMNKCVLNPLIYSLLLCYITTILSYLFKITKTNNKTVAFLRSLIQYIKKYQAIFLITLSVLLSGFYLSKFTFIKEFVSMINMPYDTFYEQHFVEPLPQNISFRQKKNLIVISVESLEKTFENAEFFGQSLIPHLQQLEKEGIQFQDFRNGWCTTYTASSIMALFSGLPANMIGGYLVNAYGEKMNFLQSYYSLGNILLDNGYQTYSVQGSNSSFSGLGHFFETHGINRIIADEDIKTTYKITQPRDDWGYNDNIVFDVSKEIIQQIDRSTPYFMLIQTLDSHFNYEPNIPDSGIFKNNYHNIIYNTDVQIFNFINWLKTQPDYQNTVIVIVGDHLRMGNNFAMPRERHVYNLFLNAAKPQSTERTFSQIDLFPSILEALGAEVKGHRLGLGVSVFSAEKTLLEEYPDTLTEKLSKRSKLAEELWKP